MKFEEYIPTDLPRPFVKTYSIIESQDKMVNRVLPNTSDTLAFRYKGQASYISDNRQELLPTSTISGLRKYDYYYSLLYYRNRLDDSLSQEHKDELMSYLFQYFRVDTL